MPRDGPLSNGGMNPLITQCARSTGGVRVDDWMDLVLGAGFLAVLAAVVHLSAEWIMP